MTSIQTDARHETLEGLVDVLKAQQDPRLDAVVPATNLRSQGGVIHVAGLSVFGAAELTPSEDADSHIAGKLGIPVQYLRKCHASAPDIYDANVNGWLHGAGDERPFYTAPRNPDGRKFLVRAYVAPGETEGRLRALFSDKYGIVDNLDALMAVVAGINASGEQVEVVEANLSERQMTVSFAAPGIVAFAPTLLQGYRAPTGPDGVHPWTPAPTEGEPHWRQVARSYGTNPDEAPIVFAGFKVRNSETGWTKFQIDPEVRVRVCSNGMTMNVLGESFRRVHLGSRMEEGAVDWSQETMRRQLALITSQATDAVTSFLNRDKLEQMVGYIEDRADTPIENAVGTVEHVSKTFGFTEDEQATILRHFIFGTQTTAGGLLNAITSTAQAVDSVDRSHHLNDKAVEAFAAVAR